MKRPAHFALLACSLIVVVFAMAARAEGPAVSATNGKLSVESGVVGGSTSSGLGMAQGALTTPLGHSFGLQVDGLAATAYNSFLGGGTLHAFWRDPEIGLIGPVAALAGGNGSRIAWYGGEAEFYARVFTLHFQAGYQDASSARVESAAFYGGSFTFYPMPDLALTAGGDLVAGHGTATGRFEFQPSGLASHQVSFFVDGSAGDNASYRISAGARIYFGSDKSLVRRHREDDPPSLSAIDSKLDSLCSCNFAAKADLH